MAILLPSFADIQKYIGVSAIPLYFAFGAIAIFFASKLLRLLDQWPQHIVIVVALICFLALATTLLIVYPMANVHLPGRGSDGDDALDQATRALLQGRYPYLGRTYLGNPISPMPGLLILAVPFVVLGGSAYQILFWLPVMFLILAKLSGSTARALWLLLAAFGLSPALMHGMVTGSDYLVNSVVVLVGVVLTMRFADRSIVAPAKAAALILLGLSLSSRGQFFFVLPIIAGALVKRSGVRRAVSDIALVTVVAGLVTAPFFFAHPSDFSPLYTIHKLDVFPGAEVIVPLLMLATALTLGWQSDGTLQSVLASSFLVLMVPVFVVTAGCVLRGDGFEASAFGVLATMFGVTSYGVRFVGRFEDGAR